MLDNCSLLSDNSPMQERITFRATASLKAALKAEAKRDKRKLSNLVVLLLEEALKQRQHSPQNSAVQGPIGGFAAPKEAVSA